MCVNSGATTNHTLMVCGRSAGSAAASLVMVSAIAPSSLNEQAPLVSVARVVVHGVFSLGVAQL